MNIWRPLSKLPDVRVSTIQFLYPAERKRAVRKGMRACVGHCTARQRGTCGRNPSRSAAAFPPSRCCWFSIAFASCKIKSQTQKFRAFFGTRAASLNSEVPIACLPSACIGHCRGRPRLAGPETLQNFSQVCALVDSVRLRILAVTPTVALSSVAPAGKTSTVQSTK